jgi:hypothetical protein
VDVARVDLAIAHLTPWGAAPLSRDRELGL